MHDDKVTTALEVAGIAALTAFAWFLWAPAALAVVGVACLLVSWRQSTMALTPTPADGQDHSQDLE